MPKTDRSGKGAGAGAPRGGGVSKRAPHKEIMANLGIKVGQIVSKHIYGHEWSDNEFFRVVGLTPSGKSVYLHKMGQRVIRTLPGPCPPNETRFVVADESVVYTNVKYLALIRENKIRQGRDTLTPWNGQELRANTMG
jgi:hypothetical protein